MEVGLTSTALGVTSVHSNWGDGRLDLTLQFRGSASCPSRDVQVALQRRPLSMLP